MKQTLLVCITTSLLFLGSPLSVPFMAFAAEMTGKTDKPPTDNAEALIQAVEKRDQAIQALLQRVEALEREVRSLRESPRPQPAQQVAVVEESPERREEPQASVQVSTPESQEEEEQLAEAVLERVLVRQSALLLPSGTLEIEPSLTYAHSSADRILIDGVAIIDPLGIGLVIGDIVNERIRRDTLISNLGFRLGLPWDFQLEARFPYRYETERILRADFREIERDAHGLGDLEFGISNHFLHEKGWIPDLVGSLRWRAPTGDTTTGEVPLGTGFHGLQLGVSGVKVRDPVAFFWGGSYMFNLPGTQSGFDVDPGDTWGYNLGMALALNPETSMNFQWDHRFTGRTVANDFIVPGTATTVGTLRVGLTYALARNYFLDFGLGIGLTQDAPDVQATIAVPFRIPDLFSKFR